MIPKYAAVAAVATAILFVAPCSAQAGLYSNEVLVGFGEEYCSPDGGERTHRGVDLEGTAGDDVEAPISGTVCFAGRIPSPAGGSAGAVTIDSDRGRVTLSPLDGLSVEAGSLIEVGDVVGTLARSGDPSSNVTHLHLSLRSSDLYLDPSGMLTPLGGLPAESSEPDIVSMESAAPLLATSGSAVMGQGVGLATEVVAAGAGAAVAPTTKGMAVSNGSVAPVGICEPSPMGRGVQLAPDASTHTGTESEAPAMVTVPVAAAPLEAAKSASLQLARSTAHRVSAIGAPAYLALIAAIACAAIILSLRAFEQRINAREPVSDRLGRILQQLRTGATLRGLTSCSGETAFTVPGPSSPGEVTK